MKTFVISSAAVCLFAGCAESGETPDSCPPDVVLVGTPGTTETMPVELVANEPIELCLRLDTQGATRESRLEASLGGFGGEHPLVLRSLSGEELLAGADQLEWSVERGLAFHVVLEVSPAPDVVVERTALTIQLAERN